MDSCCRRLAAILELVVTRTQMRVACAEGMDQPANRDTPGVWNRYPSAPSLAVEVITEVDLAIFPPCEGKSSTYVSTAQTSSLLRCRV